MFVDINSKSKMFDHIEKLEQFLKNIVVHLENCLFKKNQIWALLNLKYTPYYNTRTIRLNNSHSDCINFLKFYEPL